MTAATCCRVPGCQLAPTGLYFQKYRICRQHYSAAVLDLGLDELHRFCQQCSRTHPLSDFDSAKLSCRAGLARHTQRRKERMQRQAEEPRKRRRRGVDEDGAGPEGGPEPLVRRVLGAGTDAPVASAWQQQPQALLPCSPLQRSLQPPQPANPPNCHVGQGPLVVLLPSAALLPQPRGNRLPGPAACGSFEAVSLLPAALGPLTPAASMDPPCFPASPAQAKQRHMMQRALRLREQVCGLLQVLQRRHAAARGPQPATRHEPASQLGTPAVRGGSGAAAAQSCGSSLSAGGGLSASVGCAQRAAPRRSLLGSSRGSAFQRWEAASHGGSTMRAVPSPP